MPHVGGRLLGQELVLPAKHHHRREQRLLLVDAETIEFAVDAVEALQHRFAPLAHAVRSVQHPDHEDATLVERVLDLVGDAIDGRRVAAAVAHRRADGAFDRAVEIEVLEFSVQHRSVELRTHAGGDRLGGLHVVAGFLDSSRAEAPGAPGAKAAVVMMLVAESSAVSGVDEVHVFGRFDDVAGDDLQFGNDGRGELPEQQGAENHGMGDEGDPITAQFLRTRWSPQRGPEASRDKRPLSSM